MKKTFVAMIVIAVMMVGGLTFIGYYLSTANKEYYEIEKTLENAAARFYGQFPEQFPASSTTITAAQLINTGFLDEIKDDCTGYVEVKKSGRFYNYTAFIDCDNYTTRKYDANLDQDIERPEEAPEEEENS